MAMMCADTLIGYSAVQTWRALKIFENPHIPIAAEE